MIRDYVKIELAKGYAFLQVHEETLVIVYIIQLSDDRSKAMVTRKVFEYQDWGKDEIGKCIQCNEQEYTLEEIKNVTLYGNTFLWLARGMWGIPLSYASEKAQVNTK